MIKTPQRTNQDKALVILKDIAYISVSFALLIATLDLIDHLLELVSS
jgi:hypothetical protein